MDNTHDALIFLEDIISRKYADKLKNSKIFLENKKKDQYNSTNDYLILKNLIDFANKLNLKNNVGIINQIPKINSDSLRINLNPVENFSLKSNTICINIQENLELLQNKYDDLNRLKQIWKKLEQIIFVSNFGTLPSMFFKSQTSVFNNPTIYNIIPEVFCNEFIEISFEIINHLSIDLILKDCGLLWKFVAQNPSEENVKFQISNDNHQNLNFVEEKSIDKILIQSNSQKIIRLLIRPKKPNGYLYIRGIKYELGIIDVSKSSSEFFGKQFFEFKVLEKNYNKKMQSKTDFLEKYINLKVVRKMPLLQVFFSIYFSQMNFNHFFRLI